MVTTSLHSSNSNVEQRPPVTSLQPFTRSVEMQGRTVREYAGILPCTKHVARHILRCEHLADVPGEPMVYKFEDGFTHQVWIWYRELANPSALQLLFRGQFDFSIPSYTLETVAISVTDYIAEALWECKNPNQVFQSPNGEVFWERVVETQLVNLLHALQPPTLGQE